MRRTAKEGGKRYPLNMRTTRELRSALEAAAQASGRSLAQEVEMRLELSVRTQQRDPLDRLLQSPTLRAVALHLMLAFERGGREKAEELKLPPDQPEEWMRSPLCYQSAAIEVGNTLNLWSDATVQEMNEIRRRFRDHMLANRSAEQ
jgi:hypothetical protein